MTEKICENCIHYNYKECNIDGTYTSPQLSCILWEEDLLD